MTLISRRRFCWTTALAAAAPSEKSNAQAQSAVERRAVEWSYVSRKTYDDPFNEVELDVVFAGPQGREQRVPAFWAGQQTWRVRYAPPVPGRHTYRTVCTDASNADLHGRAGVLEVSPYRGDNPLYRHGPIRVAAGRRHFEHADGTPFFWLGDTWWMGLCSRLRWPQDFQLLAGDRAEKGFNVIQIVAGLYPDMDSFDPRGANEAGFPWTANYQRINPAYFDLADVRIRFLVESGLMPCIVGCWGYYLPILGPEKMKKHWRYLVARWGAYPVVWCLAGEGSMPYYLSPRRDQDRDAQRSAWTDMARYLRSVDPYRHLVTIHPSDAARNTVDDPAVLDFDMLQTGHSDRRSIPNTLKLLAASREAAPVIPVINGEVCYEGIREECREEMQRFMFWACILSGAAGHTYGANGIWQVNTAARPYGPSPHGRTWGDTPWEEAYRLPGSRQLGLAKALLARYPWWRFEPHPEWVDPHASPANPIQPFAAGIPGQVRFIFLPPLWNPPRLKNLEVGWSYRGFFFNPGNGEEHVIGTIRGDASGEWPLPHPPSLRDWVLVLDNAAHP